MGQTKLTFEKGHFRLITDPVARSFTHRTWSQSNQDLKAAVPFRQHADELAEKVFKRTLNQTYFVPRMPPLTFLDKHQIEGVKWALSRKRCYLAHTPGAGKTVTTIVSFHLSGCEQALIIVPPGLTLQWKKEIEKFSKFVSFTEPKIEVISAGGFSNKDGIDFGKLLRIERADFIIVADSFLERDAVQHLLRKLLPKFIAVDEASRLKEITSTRSIAFYGGVVSKPLGERRFFGLFKGARHVLFLDGSPMPNGRHMELWAPVYALDPETIDCMDRQEFGTMYCNGHQDRFGHWQYKGSTLGTKFSNRLKARLMHVVTEDQLSHPERRRSLLFMDRDVRTVKHKSWEREHLSKLDLKNISENANQGDFARWRRELGMRKAPWVSDYVVNRFKEKNESLLVFCWHREVAQTLLESITKKMGAKKLCAMVIGGTPLKQRDMFFQQFQAGLLKIIVCNIQAVGRGYNLQKADRIVFAESSWSDELNKQCEKRASRRGRKKFVRCDYVVAPDSMDEKVMTSVFNKERKTKAVIK